MREPPFDGSAPCPMCPTAMRNLLAVAHNLVNGAHDTTLDDLKRAVELAQPFADAHFAVTSHAHSTPALAT